ncbi:MULTISPECIES: sigma-70 family RNA polymerase sigma factor [unclassified Paenibacillus]|uniref:sigma-70 family RNA polymerase sigma factor n=1 Tax=unclassified Paenibacillus TaxID=185978 RepID=UPI0005A6522B|nr:sigma-70 family RNA polymerase sigma factor [Paenibacillus sp. FSL P4-0081]
MRSYTKQDLFSTVEKGFSSYVKSCLIHRSITFFKHFDMESTRFRSLNEIKENALFNKTDYTTHFNILEDESLYEALSSLKPLEKRLIYLKFYKEYTDRQVATILGVSRQAVTKAKKKLLEKLKIKLEK